MQEYLPLGSFNELEARGFEALKSELRGSIQKGVDFVHKGEYPPHLQKNHTWSFLSSGCCSAKRHVACLLPHV